MKALETGSKAKRSLAPRCVTSQTSSTIVPGRSFQSPEKVAHILAGISKPPEKVKTSLFIRPEGTLIVRGRGYADQQHPFGSEPIEQQRKGLWSDAVANDIGLADEDIHVDQIGRQIAQSGGGELLGQWVLPTEVADKSGVDGDQSMGCLRVLADGCQGVVRVAPPASHVGPMEPNAKLRQMARRVERKKLYA